MTMPSQDGFIEYLDSPDPSYLTDEHGTALGGPVPAASPANAQPPSFLRLVPAEASNAQPQVQNPSPSSPQIELPQAPAIPPWHREQAGKMEELPTEHDDARFDPYGADLDVPLPPAMGILGRMTAVLACAGIVGVGGVIGAAIDPYLSRRTGHKGYGPLLGASLGFGLASQLHMKPWRSARPVLGVLGVAGATLLPMLPALYAGYKRKPLEGKTAVLVILGTLALTSLSAHKQVRGLLR